MTEEKKKTEPQPMTAEEILAEINFAVLYHWRLKNGMNTQQFELEKTRDFKRYVR